MSELTKCNHCSLKAIRQHAEARGATVTLSTEPGPFPVVVVNVSDRAEPVAYFMALTTHCSC
jgi:hypothetical protein